MTGAAGMTGAVTVVDLLEHGFEVVGSDVVPHPGSLPRVWSRPDFTYTRCDLTDYGDAVEVLDGVDAVVHLANIPAPGLVPAARTFSVNTVMNGNVFLAAAKLGLNRVVWASSETTLGLDFSAENPPLYAPLDEEHYPHPTTTYSLSKVVSETAAEQVSAWSGIPFVALRFSNVIGPEGAPNSYGTFPKAWADPTVRMFNLWSYIDVRDCARACRLALTADLSSLPGSTRSPSLVIAADDTVMPVPSAELMNRHFPDVPLTRGIGEFESLQSNQRAKDLIGFQPAHTWRSELQPPADPAG